MSLRVWECIRPAAHVNTLGSKIRLSPLNKRNLLLLHVCWFDSATTLTHAVVGWVRPHSHIHTTPSSMSVCGIVRLCVCVCMFMSIREKRKIRGWVKISWRQNAVVEKNSAMNHNWCVVPSRHPSIHCNDDDEVPKRRSDGTNEQFNSLIFDSTNGHQLSIYIQYIRPIPFFFLHIACIPCFYFNSICLIYQRDWQLFVCPVE